MFKLKKKSATVHLPESLLLVVEAAPAGAVYMKSSIIYSVEKGMVGHTFEGWRDSLGNPVPHVGPKPIFHREIPESAGSHFFERVRGTVVMDLVKHGFVEEPEDYSPNA